MISVLTMLADSNWGGGGGEGRGGGGGEGRGESGGAGVGAGVCAPATFLKQSPIKVKVSAGITVGFGGLATSCNLSICGFSMTC